MSTKHRRRNQHHQPPETAAAKTVLHTTELNRDR